MSNSPSRLQHLAKLNKPLTTFESGCERGSEKLDSHRYFASDNAQNRPYFPSLDTTMNILRFDSLEAWVDGVTTFWCGRLRAAPQLRHCLASGSTPLPIFDAMVKANTRSLVSFSQAEVFALDEYGGLPQEDEGRCANMLRRRLAAQVDLPKNKFHCFDPEARDLVQMCREYEAAIGPGFDLSLLGLGLNGHLGLNEPGSLPDSPVRRVDMAPQSIAASAQYVAHSSLPRWGVTVGLRRLLDSKEVWLLVQGKSKAEIVRRVLTGGIGPEVPASFLRWHPRCSLFLDAEAAALLNP